MHTQAHAHTMLHPYTHVHTHAHTHMYAHTHAHGFICGTFVGIVVNSSKLILGFLSWTAINHTLWFLRPRWRPLPLFGFLCHRKQTTAMETLGTSRKKITLLLRLSLFVFSIPSIAVSYKPWTNIWKSSCTYFVHFPTCFGGSVTNWFPLLRWLALKFSCLL